jgi:hypothetical protein
MNREKDRESVKRQQWKYKAATVSERRVRTKIKRQRN